MLALALCVAGCAVGAHATGTLEPSLATAPKTTVGGEYVAIINAFGDLTKGGLFELGTTGTTPEFSSLNSAASLLMIPARNGDFYSVFGGKVGELPPGSATPWRYLIGTTQPVAGVVDAAGNLFLIDGQGSGMLLQYTTQTNAPVKTVKKGVSHPARIALDTKTGHVFVVNGGSGSVLEYDNGLNVVRSIRAPHAQTLAVDPNRSLLYVAYLKSVSVYGPNGASPLHSIAFGPKTGSVCGLGVDSNGILYAQTVYGDYGIGRLLSFSPGATKPTHRIRLGVGGYGTGSCSDPAIDAENDVYVINVLSSFHYGADVLEYSSAGTLMRTLHSPQSWGDAAASVVVVP